jgi:hypothetical protein
MLETPGKWIRAVEIQRLNYLLDLRCSDSAGTAPEPGLDAAAALLGFLTPGGRWPEAIAVHGGTMEVLANGSRWVLEGLDLTLDENKQGRLALAGLVLQAGRITKGFGPLSAPTAWESGTLTLAGLEIVPGVVVNDISLRLAEGGEASVSFHSHVFGGTLRGDVNLRSGTRGRSWDIAVVASNIAAESLPSLLDFPDRATGTLSEGRFTFRGEVGHPADAEASLRVLARDFHWNDRGWESLEIGASLIHRRLLVSNFDLRQKENSVTMNGEISLGEGWAKISESPFLINVRAKIQELDSLAGLLGGPLGDASGQLTAEGSVSGRAGSLDGFASIRASGVTFHSVALEQMRVEVLFRKKTAELVVCEVKSGTDRLTTQGTVELAFPHSYSAKLEASLGDVANYLKLTDWPAGATAGALGVRWEGKGTAEAHEGAFDLDLSHFVSALTPAGLTGKFSGTYSPKNVYFSTLEMQNAKLHFHSRATLSVSGVNFEDAVLTANGKPLLIGEAFLPLDPFKFVADGDWRDAVRVSDKMYLRALTPGELDLKNLLKLAGQNYPLGGFVRMEVEAYGPPSGFDAKGWVRGREVFWGEGEVPRSRLEVEFGAKAGQASLKGVLEPAGMGAVKISAHSTFGLATPGGSLRWVDATTPFDAEVEFPRTSLALLRPLLPSLSGLAGEISGHLKITNTLATPQIDGEAEIKRAVFGFQKIAAQLEVISGQVRMDGNAVRFKNITGSAGQGRFEAEGAWFFSNGWTPSVDIFWRGEGIPLQDDGTTKLFVNGDLHRRAETEGGDFTGHVEFTGSSIAGGLVVQPVLGAFKHDLPDWANLYGTLRALAGEEDLKLDVSVGCLEPVAVKGRFFSGMLVPDLHLGGTVASPLPTGRLSLAGVDVAAPAGGFTVMDGWLDFLPDAPWDPFMSIEAEGTFGNHVVRAFAYGPLSEGKWLLSSPTISLSTPQTLFLLVRQGVVPLPVEENTQGPTDAFPSERADGGGFAGVFSTHLTQDSAWHGGVGFRDCLNWSLQNPVLPMEAFQSEFAWRICPAP